jgi:SAM-dependent methyltransferase
LPPGSGPEESSALDGSARDEQGDWVDDGAGTWDRTYATRSNAELSWYQREPDTSVRLIESVACGPSSAIVDVGSGTSYLVDRLLALGFVDLTVLDVAERALEQVRTRLGGHAHRVTFVHHDVITWEPDREYDVMHDRAVFHFVTDADQCARYASVAARVVRRGGAVVIATFAEDGPTHCSGFPVSRYSSDELAGRFSAAFSLVAHEREDHVTPAGVVQPFTWAVLRRAFPLHPQRGP